MATVIPIKATAIPIKSKLLVSFISAIHCIINIALISAPNSVSIAFTALFNLSALTADKAMRESASIPTAPAILRRVLDFKSFV